MDEGPAPGSSGWEVGQLAGAVPRATVFDLGCAAPVAARRLLEDLEPLGAQRGVSVVEAAQPRLGT